MELALNLVWLTLVLAVILHWWRAERVSGRSIAAQLVALGVLLFVLFPVISLTDDIWAAQHPAETDTTLRRNDLTSHPHTIVPHPPVLHLAVLAGLSLHPVSYRAVREASCPKLRIAPRTSLSTRPPPAL